MSTLVAGAIAVGTIVLGILWRMLSVAKKSGIDQRKAEEAKARDENIRRIKAAIDAGGQPLGKLSDDPNNLDR